MNNIKKLRKAKKLSQTEFAKLLNIHQTAISQWETGRTNPDMAQAIEIANIFEVSTDYLLGVTNDSIPQSKGAPPEINTEEILEKIRNLSPENQAKAKEYIDMLKTLSDVQSGENIIDFAKKA